MLFSSPSSHLAQQKPITVSELNRQVRVQLESSFSHLRVTGEISNLSRPASGHLYFTLKDSDSQIRCALFRNRQSSRTQTLRSLQNGQRVIVRARVSLYEPRGDYQLIVEHIEPAGVGELQQLFEALKQRLANEGLFDPNRKRPILSFPSKIGVITSPSGAALRDVISVLRRRCPMVPVILYPTLVQGEGAAEQLTQSILTAGERAECDTLILCRGGGSIEDLWAFNDERLARTIANSPIPIISGVGHEIDFTIADFVADVRAPTPSVAAELAVPDQEKLSEQLTQLRRALQHAYLRSLTPLKQRYQMLSQRLLHLDPRRQITQQRQQLDYLTRDLVRLQERLIQTRREHLQRTAIALDAISPLKTLERGYTILMDRDSESVITRRDQVAPDQCINAHLSDGHIVCRVISTHREELLKSKTPPVSH